MAAINTTYTKTGTFLPSNAQGVSYFWIVNGNILSGQGTNTISYQFTTTGTKNITFTAFNDCSSVDKTIAYEVCADTPTVSIVPRTPAPYYNGQSYTFDAVLASAGDVSYQWTVTGASTVTSVAGAAITISAATGEQTTISVTVANCSNINQTASLIFTVFPVPTPTVPSPGPTAPTAPVTPVTPVTPVVACIPLTSCTFS